MTKTFENNETEKGGEIKNELLNIEQITTRGDGKIEKGEEFLRDDIDFKNALEHLNIHHGGEIAGSVFNAEVVKDPEAVKKMIINLLPEKLNYDQFGRAEITLEVGGIKKPLGFSGISSIEDIQKKFPGVEIKKEIRMPGGEASNEGGIDGAWYPETTRDENGKFVPAKDAEGNIKNPKGKFEPESNIAYVSNLEMESTMATRKMTIILSKEKESGKPSVLTIFPGENAPAFPAKIDTENYKANTLDSTNESEFWKKHVFIRKAPEVQPAESLPELANKDGIETAEKLAKVRENLGISEQGNIETKPNEEMEKNRRERALKELENIKPTKLTSYEIKTRLTALEEKRIHHYDAVKPMDNYENLLKDIPGLGTVNEESVRKNKLRRDVQFINGNKFYQELRTGDIYFEKPSIELPSKDVYDEKDFLNLINELNDTYNKYGNLHGEKHDNLYFIANDINRLYKDLDLNENATIWEEIAKKHDEKRPRSLKEMLNYNQ